MLNLIVMNEFEEFGFCVTPGHIWKWMNLEKSEINPLVVNVNIGHYIIICYIKFNLGGKCDSFIWFYGVWVLCYPGTFIQTSCWEQDMDS